MKDYQDIIDIVYPYPSNHLKMPRKNRAAQFAPFAALTGYNEMVVFSTIEKDKPMNLDENKVEEIEDKIKALSLKVKEKVFVKVTYYHFDEYKIKTGVITKIDEYTKELIFDDSSKVMIKEIVDIASDIFD